MFRRAKQINTPIGQLVVAAMVFDDIIALILISVLQARPGLGPVGPFSAHPHCADSRALALARHSPPCHKNFSLASLPPRHSPPSPFPPSLSHKTLRQTLNDPSPSKVAVPVGAAIGFLIAGGFLALYVVPKLLTRVILPRVPPKYLETAMLSLLTIWVRFGRTRPIAQLKAMPCPLSPWHVLHA